MQHAPRALALHAPTRASALRVQRRTVPLVACPSESPFSSSSSESLLSSSTSSHSSTSAASSHPFSSSHPSSSASSSSYPSRSSSVPSLASSSSSSSFSSSSPSSSPSSPSSPSSTPSPSHFTFTLDSALPGPRARRWYHPHPHPHPYLHWHSHTHTHQNLHPHRATASVSSPPPSRCLCATRPRPEVPTLLNPPKSKATARSSTTATASAQRRGLTTSASAVRTHSPSRTQRLIPKSYIHAPTLTPTHPHQNRNITWAHILRPLRPLGLNPAPSSPGSIAGGGLGGGGGGGCSGGNAGGNGDFPEHPDNEHDVARAAILDKVMKGRQPTDLMLRCTVLDAEGNVKTISGQFKKSDLCAEHKLNARDLRKIDSRVPNLVPTILVRKEAILVNILHIRALVKADTVILFDTYGSADSRLHSVFLYHLEHNLKTKNAGMPYEFRALDSILLSVLSALEAEMVFIRTLVGGLLAEMDDTIDHDRFKRLLHYSRRLAGFRNRAGLVEEAITEVLSQDEDMDAMYLTEKKKRRARSRDRESGRPLGASTSASGLGVGVGAGAGERLEGLESALGTSTSTGEDAREAVVDADLDLDLDDHRLREEHDHEELEVLLESFSKQVEEIVNEAETIETNVQSTQEIVELILDANRNALLALDLKVSIATLGVGSGALVAGLFGMNLMSHVETHPYGFLVVTGSAGLLAFGVAWAGLRRLAKIRKVGLASSAAAAHRPPHPWVALPLRGRNPGGWS